MVAALSPARYAQGRTSQTTIDPGGYADRSRTDRERLNLPSLAYQVTWSLSLAFPVPARAFEDLWARRVGKLCRVRAQVEDPR